MELRAATRSKDDTPDLPELIYRRALSGEKEERGHQNAQRPVVGLPRKRRSSGTAARGHFSTKSRTHSTTLDALRAAHQREHAMTTGLLPDAGGETVLVLAHWSFTGRAPNNPRSAAATGTGPERPHPPLGR